MAILLNEADVKSLLPMPELIGIMEQALCAFSEGRADQPVRSIVEVGADRNFFGVMPAYIQEPAAVGAKLVTFFVSNGVRGIPTHFANILLLDPETGLLQAILDGRYITEARTAAVSAVSAQWLARPDSRRLAILGSGVQARSHLEALSHVFRFDSTRAWSPTPEKLGQFRGATGVEAAASAEDAVRDADIIVTATSARQPVLLDGWVQPGTHIIAVGSCRPTHREIDPLLVARARLFVDSRAGALKEAGDILLAIEEGHIEASHIARELGERPQRESAEEITLFKSLGMAVEDVAAAHLVYRKARQKGVGFELPL